MHLVFPAQSSPMISCSYTDPEVRSYEERSLNVGNMQEIALGGDTWLLGSKSEVLALGEQVYQGRFAHV
jgi:hypothetical protein